MTKSSFLFSSKYKSLRFGYIGDCESNGDCVREIRELEIGDEISGWSNFFFVNNDDIGSIGDIDRPIWEEDKSEGGGLRYKFLCWGKIYVDKIGACIFNREEEGEFIIEWSRFFFVW